jgi:hypothetical protein
LYIPRPAQAEPVEPRAHRPAKEEHVTDVTLGPLLAAEADAWDGIASAASDDTALYLELDGWEGPLDLLLDLARRQKVDLRRISILELVDQYIGYIERAEAMRLELAADYLVMAAWLAYLKSSLLLPRDEQEDPSAEELAMRLQLRLQRLGAMPKRRRGCWHATGWAAIYLCEAHRKVYGLIAKTDGRVIGSR